MDRTLHSLPRVSLVFSGSLSVSLSPPTGKCSRSSMTHAASKKDPIKEGDAMSLPLFYFYYRDYSLSVCVIYCMIQQKGWDEAKEEKKENREKGDSGPDATSLTSLIVFFLSHVFFFFFPSFVFHREFCLDSNGPFLLFICLCPFCFVAWCCCCRFMCLWVGVESKETFFLFLFFFSLLFLTLALFAQRLHPIKIPLNNKRVRDFDKVSERNESPVWKREWKSLLHTIKCKDTVKS